MGLFTDLFSSQPAQDAAAAKDAGYAAGNTDANTALDAGVSQTNPLYSEAAAPFTSLIDQSKGGTDAYADATGANGQEGLDRAKTAYQSVPGYSGGLTTGIDQVNRTAASRGDLAGGNTSADEIKFASDYDAKNYSSYLSSLAPWLSTATGAATGQAGVLTSQAGNDSNVASQKAQYGYNADTGTGNANADAALAPYSASQNFWNSILGGANLALKASGVGGFAPTAAKASA